MWAALDGDFYLALAAGHEGCQSLIDSCGPGFLLLPTAYQNIINICIDTTDQEVRNRAFQALSEMATLGVLAAPSPSENLGFDDGLARALIERGLIQEDDKDSALILGEAASQGVEVLLTLDPVILAVNKETLRTLIEDKHLTYFEIKTCEIQDVP